MPIEMKGVSELATTFGRIPIEVRAELRPALLQAANLIATQARANSSWSSRIPGAIYAKASFSVSGGAIVGVDQHKAPEAKVFEHGNIGRRETIFRHPVFGHREVWVGTQKVRPYLWPAVEAKKPEALGLIAAAVRKATTL